MNVNKKRRNDYLILIADNALIETGVLFKEKTQIIPDSYNGQIAALSVSIAMSGLKPALTIYYQDKKDKSDTNRRLILDVIAKMISLDKSYKNEFKNAEALYEFVVRMNAQGEEWMQIKTEILDCSIALKQLVRTYKLEK